MRIASWNVNSVRTRLDQVLAWLRQERPEVLCLQETKVDDPLFPHQAFAELGYSAAISGQKAYNGVALLSRQPLEDVRIGFSALLAGDGEASRLDDQKRVISARLDGLRFLNLYVPNGSALKSEKYAYKLQWLECLGRYLAAQEAQGEPLVMLGDFNIGPEDRDLPNPERQALRAVLGERLHDVFRVFEPETGHWSWWDYRSGAWERDQGWRIDHIYLDAELLELATGCLIHKATRGNPQPSDHAPVVVNLAWPPAGDEGKDDPDW